jgi:hypothetical protein
LKRRGAPELAHQAKLTQSRSFHYAISLMCVAIHH